LFWAIDIWLLLGSLGQLHGVQEACVVSGKATITGERRAIAHVGASLVADGWIPPDLTVRVPSLEDALVNLLESGEAGTGPIPDVLNSLTATPRRIGAIR
jgi:hypothetical protein